MLTLVAASLLTAFGPAHAQDAAASAASGPGKPPATAPGELKPYKDVLKGSTETKGFFTTHTKDEKVWLEIRPEQLDKPFFFSVNTTNGIGERGLYASQMVGNQLAYFRRNGNQIQLVAKNTGFTAQANTPQAVSVAQAFSDSLIASAPVVSAAHPDNKAFLVDANALLLADIPAYATRLDFAFRQPYAFDARNSSIGKIRADDNLTGIPVNAHYGLARIAAPPLMPSPVPQPGLPRSLPDPRSMFIGFYYNFAALPATPMTPRMADDRIGYFVSTQQDFTDDTTPNNRRHMVNRWRLEKKDPQAALSEPVKPITYWLDKNIPLKYRKSITEGVLEWNLAFEKIGFKNALVVKQQQDGDDFDTLDANHASIRWFLGADVGFAIGPSHVDERTGEILDADIGMSEVFSRGARRFIGEDGQAPLETLAHPFHAHGKQARCTYGMEAPNEFNFALDLLEARGEFGMDSPKAEALAQAYVKDVMMHEIGHTLGLRHNFRSSTIYTLKQWPTRNLPRSTAWPVR